MEGINEVDKSLAMGRGTEGLTGDVGFEKDPERPENEFLEKLRMVLVRKLVCELLEWFLEDIST